MLLAALGAIAIALTLAATDAAYAGGKVREPAYACPEAGAGFIQFPGTDTCFIIRADVALVYQHEFVDEDLVIATLRSNLAGWQPTALYGLAPLPAASPKSLNYVDARVSLTTYQPTEMGPLVSHISLRSIPNFLIANPANLFAPALFVQPANDGPAFLLDQAWIKWANFTFGKHPSMFNFLPGYNYVDGYASVAELTLFAYSRNLSDSVSAVISIEDQAQRRYQDGVWAAYGRGEIPEIVAAIRATGERGVLHVAGALHQIRDANPCCIVVPPFAFANDNPFGWALTAGGEYRFKYSNGMFGRVLVSGAYADGALSYLGIPFFATDYITNANGTVATTRGYSAVIAYEHVWRDNLKTAVTISLYGTETEAIGFTWNTRGLFAQAGVEYMPTPGFALGLEVDYFKDQVQGIPFGVPLGWNKVDFVRALVYARRRI